MSSICYNMGLEDDDGDILHDVNDGEHQHEDEDDEEEDEDDDVPLDLEDLEELQQSKVATPTCCFISGVVALAVGLLSFGLALSSFLLDESMTADPPDERTGSDYLPIIMVCLGGIPLSAAVFFIGCGIYIWCINRNEYSRVRTMIELQKKQELV